MINEQHMIPVERGQAVSERWTSYADRKPLGVTWHWTATWDLATCTKILGGANAMRKPKHNGTRWKGGASAHYGIGRSFEEGVHRYVSLENRSWHAGVNQTLRWDGKSARHEGRWWSGARTTIGVETVNIGYARRGVRFGDDWVEAASPDGRQQVLVQPWTEEQLELMIHVGKEIVARWPHIKPQDHHGHVDICPGYKLDPIGFPYARLMHGIYDDPDYPDLWSPFLAVQRRQRALERMGYKLGGSGKHKDGVDGDWGRLSDAALREFQHDHDLVENGMWTAFVSRAMHQSFADERLSLRDLSGEKPTWTLGGERTAQG